MTDLPTQSDQTGDILAATLQIFHAGGGTFRTPAGYTIAQSRPVFRNRLLGLIDREHVWGWPDSVYMGELYTVVRKPREVPVPDPGLVTWCAEDDEPLTVTA